MTSGACGSFIVIFIPEASLPRPPMFESVHRTDARFETILGKTKRLIYLIDVLVFFNVFVFYVFVLKW